MYRETCYFSSDYEEEIRSLGNPTVMAKMTKVVQFPYTQPVSMPLRMLLLRTQDVVDRSEAEVAAAADRRREQGKRLQDMQTKQRAEKVIITSIDLTHQRAVKIAELDEYRAILADRATLKRTDFLTRVTEMAPFESEAELEAWIKKTEADIRRKQRKDLGEEPELEEDPTFPLVDRPDDELNDAEVKEKKKQRLMKAGWEARLKVREEKRKDAEKIASLYAAPF